MEEFLFFQKPTFCTPKINPGNFSLKILREPSRNPVRRSRQEMHTLDSFIEGPKSSSWLSKSSLGADQQPPPVPL